MTTSQVVAPRFPAPLGVVRTRSPACETFRWMKTRIPPYRANHTSFGLKSAGNPLTYNGRDHARFEVKPLILAIKNVTLNQRVQGSSPCAPTNKIKDLADKSLPPPTKCRSIVETADRFAHSVQSNVRAGDFATMCRLLVPAALLVQRRRARMRL
jgi:hypothetical protein